MTSKASSTGPLFTLFVSTWGHWHVSNWAAAMQKWPKFSWLRNPAVEFPWWFPDLWHQKPPKTSPVIHRKIGGGAHDFRMTVEDPSWDVQSVLMDRCPATQAAVGISRQDLLSWTDVRANMLDPVGGLEMFGTFVIFPYVGNNHPNWLSNHQPVDNL
jgi:hypothetical protein